MDKPSKVELERTRFILMSQMSSAVMSLNSIFCVSGSSNENELANSPGFIYNLAKGIAVHTTPMALDDAILVLMKAKEVKEKEKV